MRTLADPLMEDELPAIAAAMGVRDRGHSSLRTWCPNPGHPGDRDLNFVLWSRDDGTLYGTCFSHRCPWPGCATALRELIGPSDAQRGPVAPRPRRAPVPLPRAADRAHELNALREWRETGRWGCEAMLTAAGWLGHEDALAALSVGYDGSLQPALTIPVYDAAGELVNVVRYRPGAESGPKNYGMRGRPKGLVPAPERVTDLRRVYLFEGEPDGLTATLAGLPATSFPGVDGWRPEFADRLRRFREVVIVPDCDAEGRAAAKRIQRDLARRGIRAVVLDLDPRREDGFDFRDLHREMAR